MNSKYFDIADYSGHKAIGELYKCFRLYNIPLREVLPENNVQINSFNFNEKSTFKTDIEKISLLDLDIEKIDHIDSFHYGGYLKMLNKKEIEYCINTAVFFQVMMESTINDLGYKGYFHEKWEKFFEDNKAEQSVLDDFQFYLENIYRGIRNKTVHPKKKIGLRNVEMFCFSHVYENIKRGWFCFVFLLNKTNGIELNKENNWNQMCEISGIPNEGNIELEKYPDIEKMTELFYKKHLNGINNKG